MAERAKREEAVVAELPALNSIKAQPYGLKGFSAFCNLLGLELYAYERTILRDYFKGKLETLVLIPKKNGKSTLLAALALYHILKTPQAKCFIGASAREQASLIFWQAETLVNDAHLNADEGGPFEVLGGYRHIRCGGGLLRVLAGDAKTADGVGPTLALVDELHRHRSLDLYTTLFQGLRGGSGQIITISTAGASLDSPLGYLRDRAYELPGRTRKGMYTHVETPSFVMHEWAMDSSEDYDDLKVVKRANPAPWITLDKLQEFRDSPSMTKGDWLRFACNIWTEGDEPPIEPKLWDGARGIGDFEAGADVWVGVVLGQQRKDCAIATIRRSDEQFFCRVEILPGESTYSRLEGKVRELGETFNVEGVVYTSRGFQRSADLLEEDGMRIIEFPPSDARMTEATATFMKLLEEGRLHHDGSKDLRAHVMAARAKETEKGWRFYPDPKSQRPVAGLFAIVATVHVAVTDEPPRTFAVGWL